MGPPEADRHLRRRGARGSAPALGAVDLDRRAVRAHRRRQTTGSIPAEPSPGADAAERFLLEWRGEADPKHVQAIDTYWICTAEHGLNASTFTARIVASTGADCARGALLRGRRALRPAARRRSGARAADARRAPPSPVDPEALRRRACSTRGERLMGFGHRVYRAEDPRARLLKRHSEGARLAALRGRRGARAGGARRAAQAAPDRPLETNVEFWSAVVLDVADIPPQLAPAMFACSRTAGWSAHILEQKRLGPARPAVGALRRPRPRAPPPRSDGPSRRQRRSPTSSPPPATSASSRRSGRSGTTSSSTRRGTRTTASGRRPTARSRSSASARSSSCSGAGSRTRARPRAARP